MGGKQKQSQRTKGNTRPSSSGRSAEKLMTSGVPVAAGFSEFGAIQLQNEHLGLMKAKTPTNEVDPLIDGDCRMLMKRMTKKDAVTRLKALQEFQSFCMQCTDQTLLGALPFWPRLFNKLCLDSDRKVREATHNANIQLVKRAKRNLAPHLKCMMGHWWMAQCDPHAPAASAANLAFQTAFAQDKQLEALVFCKEEILNVIVEHLFHHTPQTLSDPEFTPVEEMEETFNRVASSSLTALGLFLDRLPSYEHEKLIENYRAIVSEGKFWKCAKNKVPQICSSWFAVVAIMCRVIPSILEAHLSKLCPAVFNKLNDADPVIVSSVWDTALHILVAFENCWQHVSLPKTVLPKLWSILRKGCDGNAAVIGPYLLPFISKIPLELIASPGGCYAEFFTSIRDGLSLYKVQQSSSECTALISAYFECLKFLFNEITRRPQFVTATFVEDLVVNQILPIAEACLLESNSFLMRDGHLFISLGNVLNYIHHQSLAEDDSSEWFKKSEKRFWESFDDTCSSMLRDYNETKEFSLLILPSMLSAFVTSECLLQLKKKSPGKVRFADSTECCSDLLVTNMSKNPWQVLDPPFAIVSNDLCALCALNLSSTALEVFLSEMSAPHLKFLSDLSKTFASTDFFNMLLQTPLLSKRLSMSVSEDPTWIFYEQVILKQFSNDKHYNDIENISRIVGLIFAVLRCSVGDNKLAVLNKLCDAENIYLLEATLQIITPLCAEVGFVRKWMKGMQFSDRILHCAEFLLNSVEQHRSKKRNCGVEEKAVWSILTICLKTPENLSKNCVIKILRVTLHLLIPSVEDNHCACVEVVDNICQLAYEFFQNSPYCWTFRDSDELLLSLFKLDFEQCMLTKPISVSVEKIWMNSVASLIKTQGGLLTPGKFLHAASCYMHDFILQSDWSMHRVNVISSMFNKLLLAILGVAPLDPVSVAHDDACSSFLEELLVIILPLEVEWNQMLGELCGNILLGDALRGKLFLQRLPVLKEMDHHAKCDGPVMSSLMVANVLAELCEQLEKAGRIPNVCHLWNHLMGILNVMTFCKLASEHIKNFNDHVHGKDLKHWSFLLREKFQFLHKKFSEIPNFEHQLLNDTFHGAEVHGSLWAYSLRELVDIFKECNIVINIKKLINFDFVNKRDVTLHVLKVLLPLDKQLSLEFLSDVLTNEEFLSSNDITKSTSSLAVIQICLENLTCEDIDELDVISKLMSSLIKWKESGDVYLFSCQLPHEWTPICRNIQVANVLETVVTRFCTILSSSHWDFVLCSLGSWMKSFHESCSNCASPLLEIHMFGSAMFRLTCTIARLLDGASVLSCERDKFPPDLLTEWQEFFAPGIFSPMLSLFLDISDFHTATQSKVMLADHYVLESLVKALKWIHANVIEDNSLSPLLVAQWDENDTSTCIKIKTVLNRLCPLLITPVRDIRLGAHAILRNLMPALPKYVEQKVQKTIEITEDIHLIPASLLTVLLQTNSIVDTLLTDFHLGNVCVVQPHTDSYSFTFGYLCAWDIVFQLFSNLSVEMKSRLASYLRDSGLVNSLLHNLFRLMPVDSSSWDFSKPASSFFTNLPDLDPQSGANSFELQHFACYMYYEALRQIPVVVREWWIGVDRRISSLIEKFTAKHVSPLLCFEDISAVQRDEKKFSNMTIRTRLTSREVVATYAVDEIAFELTVRLAENHPLGAVTIETGRRVGVSNPQWSYWLLQLTIFLMHQNGSILDGLILWKRNIDKKFEGVEECYVCFYVLHATTSQLPKLVCRTCKKKFHSSCLYKWFNTSGHSTCPLCRSIF